jgi:diaminohydroxyphosphoribosylaminopyrimidine deaminase / 5-amino-6-(5-phosphoribosylamino)uracil reductase
MQHAIRLADKALGSTCPNPAVGCVIVKDDIIIATGYTAKNGRPHAESIALDQAGENAISADMYVTLEPCSHHGVTPPCVDYIIKSGIKRVIIAQTDPDIRVNGSGIQKLRDNDIEVITDFLNDEAYHINQGFIYRITKNRPVITAKIACSLDGKIATKTGKSKWITSQKQRDIGHYFRAKNDAIMVGINTVLADNPTLNCRLYGMEDKSPIRIIMDNNLQLSNNSNIIKTASKIRTIIMTISDNKPDLECEIIRCRKNHNNMIDLDDCLNHLSNIGINNLLIEGGATLITSFMQAKLVDYLLLTQSDIILGSDGISMVGSLGIDNLEDSIKLKEIIHQDNVTLYKL